MGRTIGEPADTHHPLALARKGLMPSGKHLSTADSQQVLAPPIGSVKRVLVKILISEIGRETLLQKRPGEFLNHAQELQLEVRQCSFVCLGMTSFPLTR